MKTLSQYVWTGPCALLFLTAALPARGESFAVNTPKTADRIDFQVDLQPADPFSDANKVGAPREFSRGEVVRLVIQGTPKKGFHTYPLTKQYQGARKLHQPYRSYGKNDDLQPLWPVAETPPETVYDKSAGDFHSGVSEAIHLDSGTVHQAGRQAGTGASAHHHQCHGL